MFPILLFFHIWAELKAKDQSSEAKRPLCRLFLGGEADACGQPLASLAVGWRMRCDNPNHHYALTQPAVHKEEPLQ